MKHLKTLAAVALLALAFDAHAATAFWSGRSSFGQSITGAVGYNCEYNYAGRMVWLFFATNCPPSVEL